MRFNLMVSSSALFGGAVALLLLHPSLMVEAQSSIPSLLPAFTATGTSGATVNTVNEDIWICPDETLTFTLCSGGATATGDTLIRLFDGNEQLANNDDSCGLVSQISSFSFTRSCRYYTIKQGCYGGGGCGGQMAIEGARVQIEPTAPPTLPAVIPPIPDAFPKYQASGTSGATVDTVDEDVWVCGGETLIFSLCEPASDPSGDTLLRLFDGATEIANNDDSCGLVSSIQYTFSGECKKYTLKQGCYSSNSCSGTIVILGAKRDPTAAPIGQPTVAPTAASTTNPTTQPTPTPTVSPSKQPTANPTAQPTPAPTASPTAQPTPTPTASPTAQSSVSPTPSPTLVGTAMPTGEYVSAFPRLFLAEAHCAPYTAAATNDATQNTVNCNFDVCPGKKIAFTTEQNCVGNTHIRLYDAAGNMLSASDNGSQCSRLEYQFTGHCQTYTLRQGCESTGTCSGTVMIENA